ncbi:MAG TPA: DUF488 family protein [Acidimicrobiales bacterium]|nr:DUF488 family protein [Acidimicrobiales bacterium]
MSPGKIVIARVYDEIGPDPAPRILVDRLWPRGMAKADAPFTTWAKEVAPSAALRRWYGHVEERFEEFGHRYRAELAVSPWAEALEDLRTRIGGNDAWLLTATRLLPYSHAAVLRDVLEGD